MAALKPKMTIFEIRQKKCKNVTNETANAATVMRNMRQVNADRIENFKAKRAEKITTMMEAIEKVKSEEFIPYRPTDDDAEKHLEVNSFQKEASAAMIDASSKQQNTQNKGRKVKTSSNLVLKLNFGRNFRCVSTTFDACQAQINSVNLGVGQKEKEIRVDAG